MSGIDKIIKLLDFLDEDIPNAKEIYHRSHEAYLSGDLILAKKLERLNYILHNSSIPYTARIGKNGVFAYGGIGIIVHGSAVLGERCNIGSNVTIGGSADGVPIIGDDVYISTGAKIIGSVTIGHGAIVGANSVVRKDIPPFSVAVGVPAVIKNSISKLNFGKYQGFYWCKNSPENIEIFLNYYFG